MTKLYEATAIVTLRVEANDMREARRIMRGMVHAIRNDAEDGVTIRPVLNDRTTLDVKQI